MRNWRPAGAKQAKAAWVVDMPPIITHGPAADDAGIGGQGLISGCLRGRQSGRQGELSVVLLPESPGDWAQITKSGGIPQEFVLISLKMDSIEPC